jgi:RNA polymerase sigma-70 factor (ECF subfamily)
MGDETRAGAATRRSSQYEERLPHLPELAELVKRMAAGYQDALAQLYDATSSMVNGLLLRILEHSQDAEEVLMDVYMKAWKYASGYSERRGSVRAWLLIMARNAAIDRIRHRRAQPSTLTYEPDIFPEPVAPDASPEEESALREHRVRVQQVLKKLPAEQREALVLAFFAGLTHAELAERLGEPLGTVNPLQTARRRIQLKTFGMIGESAR